MNPDKEGGRTGPMKSTALKLPVIAAVAVFLFADAAVSAQISPKANSAYPVFKIDDMRPSNIYLKSLDVQVEVAGNVASTRHTMVVKNSVDWVVEGCADLFVAGRA